MKYRNLLLIIIVLSYTLVSCSKNELTHTPNKKKYIERISNLSDNERKRQLADDAKFLTSLLNSDVKDIQIYFSFSFGSGDSGFKENIDTAKGFSLPNTDSLQLEFSKLAEVSAKQEYATPQSSFKIYSPQSFKHFDARDLGYEIKNVFAGGKTIMLTDLGLKEADSLQVTASYTYPTAFETLEIDRSAKDSVAYKGYVIDIKKMDAGSIEMEVPSALNVLEYQAISQNGVLMNSTGISSFPVIGLSPVLEKSLKEMANILTVASQLNDKTACVAELKKIAIEDFSCIPSILNFRRDFQKMEANKSDNSEDKLKLIKKYKEQYAGILGPRFQSVELSFPQPYSKILLYVSKGTQSISKDVTAMCEKDENAEAYRIFTDKNSGKTGVIDKKSNIVIPANYKNLYHAKGLYFEEQIDGDNTVSYYLNEKEKTLKKLPKNISFKSILKDGFCVFYNKDDYKGVLLNNEKQIIPYIYDNISLSGNILIAKGSKRGRNFYEFYTLDGQKLAIPFVKDVDTSGSNSNIIVCSKEGKYGLINANGKLAIPMQYARLKMMNDNLLKFSMTKGNHWYDNLWQIINAEGKEVVPQKFSSISGFYKGYALARVENGYCLIDSAGKMLSPFPANTSVSDKETEDGSELYYETDNGQKYTFDGKLIKK